MFIVYIIIYIVYAFKFKIAYFSTANLDLKAPMTFI